MVVPGCPEGTVSPSDSSLHRTEELEQSFTGAVPAAAQQGCSGGAAAYGVHRSWGAQIMGCTHNGVLWFIGCCISGGAAAYGAVGLMGCCRSWGI